jgi:hypothetical protein
MRHKLVRSKKRLRAIMATRKIWHPPTSEAVMNQSLSTNTDPVSILVVEDDPMVNSFCARLLHM